QVRQRGADAADLGEQLDLDVTVPVVVGQRGEPPGPGRAGVVDQDVGAAQRGGGGRDERLDLAGVGDIAGQRGDAATRGGQLGGRLCELGLVAGAYGRRRALGQQLGGDGLAQPLRTAGHDGPAAAQAEVHQAGSGEGPAAWPSTSWAWLPSARVPSAAATLSRLLRGGQKTSTSRQWLSVVQAPCGTQAGTTATSPLRMVRTSPSRAKGNSPSSTMTICSSSCTCRGASVPGWKLTKFVMARTPRTG